MQTLYGIFVHDVLLNYYDVLRLLRHKINVAEHTIWIRILMVITPHTFLGIIIDECLTWNDHIAYIMKKIIKASGIISKIRHYVNRNAMKLIYYALVYPYLIYGNLVWGKYLQNSN